MIIINFIFFFFVFLRNIPYDDASLLEARTSVRFVMMYILPRRIMQTENVLFSIILNKAAIIIERTMLRKAI